MFDGLIVGNLAKAIAESAGDQMLIEIRLRVGRQALVLTFPPRRIGVVWGGAPYKVSRDDIDGILARATNMSVYSVSDEMAQGYVPSKRVRIGVAGEGVMDGGKLIGVKNASYLVVRIPHQIRSAADALIDRISTKGGVKSALVISPPAAGKTTLLRELARKLSASKNVVLIDERYELAFVCDGAPQLDVGDCEVVSGIPKTLAYANCVRAMNPDVIVTDEVFGAAQAQALVDVIRCGVSVLASVHGADVAALRRSAEYAPLIDNFDIAVTLAPVGRVTAVEDLWSTR